jgi:hypothetical protein
MNDELLTEDEYYGGGDSGEEKTVQERCRDFYAVSDFVVVMNIDTESFKYQVQRPENFSEDQPSAAEKNIYEVRHPEVITLKPGETRLCPAYESDIMIKALIDKMVYRKRGKAIADGIDPNIIKESVRDPATQTRYIKKIYQGRRDFLAEYNQSVNISTERKASIEDELENTDGDEPTEKVKRGRPRTTPQTT